MIIFGETCNSYLLTKPGKKILLSKRYSSVDFERVRTKDTWNKFSYNIGIAIQMRNMVGVNTSSSEYSMLIG